MGIKGTNFVIGIEQINWLTIISAPLSVQVESNIKVSSRLRQESARIMCAI